MQSFNDFIEQQRWSMTRSERELVSQTLISIVEWMEMRKGSELSIYKMFDDLELHKLDSNVRHVALTTMIAIGKNTGIA